MRRLTLHQPNPRLCRATSIEKMEKFKYPPLRSFQANIRLTHLKPSQGIVTLSLFSASLEGRPAYEALSYTWGNINKRIEIRCNDQRVTIPQNLHDALRHLRYADRTRALWVDGICINQGDNSEKSAQIRLMPLIFETAQIILTWIGKADDRTLQTFSEIRRLAHSASVLNTDTESVPSHSEHGYTSERNAFRDISKDIFSILLRDWFQRI